jgi:hypothetical protein
MSKRPTPKKRLSKDRGRRRHSAYIVGEVKRLVHFSRSPYAAPAKGKDRGSKALEKITKVKA